MLLPTTIITATTAITATTTITTITTKGYSVHHRCPTTPSPGLLLVQESVDCMRHLPFRQIIANLLTTSTFSVSGDNTHETVTKASMLSLRHTLRAQVSNLNTIFMVFDVIAPLLPSAAQPRPVASHHIHLTLSHPAKPQVSHINLYFDATDPQSLPRPPATQSRTVVLRCIPIRLCCTLPNPSPPRLNHAPLHSLHPFVPTHAMLQSSKTKYLASH
ncbi:hypothetical protein F5887DRAFT_1021631 [Amanita rubescens]|nr:hypothetical protein F5887DRAFT_1021631 [Amanita rubescens]